MYGSQVQRSELRGWATLTAPLLDCVQVLMPALTGRRIPIGQTE